VKIALHPEVAVTVHVNVARSPEEADLQAQGIDVLQQMFEQETAPVVAEELAEAAAEEAPVAAEEAPAEAAEEPAAAEGEGEAERAE
jgi:large subunit ribosomal protein L9